MGTFGAQSPLNDPTSPFAREVYGQSRLMTQRLVDSRGTPGSQQALVKRNLTRDSRGSEKKKKKIRTIYQLPQVTALPTNAFNNHSSQAAFKQPLHSQLNHPSVPVNQSVELKGSSRNSKPPMV